MKKLLSLTLLISILAGGLLTMASTAFFTGTKSWRAVDKCYGTYNNELPPSIANVYCSGREYGFPVHSMYVKPQVDISPMGNRDGAKTLIGVSGTVRFSVMALIINFLIWTAVSYGVVWLVRLTLRKQRESAHPATPIATESRDEL